MAQGSKARSTAKQRRKAVRIEQVYENRGVTKKNREEARFGNRQPAGRWRDEQAAGLREVKVTYP